MANNTVWQVSHYLCVLAHLGMVIAGIATFAVNAQINTQDLESNFDNRSKSTFPWAVGGIGVFGLGSNGIIFWVLLKLQHAPASGTTPGTTPEAYYLKRKIRFMISLMLQLFMTAVDIAIGAVVAGHGFNPSNLAGPVALAITAGILSLATGIADISQFRDYRQEHHGHGNGMIEEDKSQNPDGGENV